MTENVAQTTERLMGRIKMLENLLKVLHEGELSSRIAVLELQRRVLLSFLFDKCELPRFSAAFFEEEAVRALPPKVREILREARDNGDY